MLRVKNQYDEIMSLRVQEPFHLLETEHEQPQGQRYLTPWRKVCHTVTKRPYMKRDTVGNHTFP